MKTEKKVTKAKKNEKLNMQLIITALVFVVFAGGYLFLNRTTAEEADLSVIKEGHNVVVQVHDPG